MPTINASIDITPQRFVNGCSDMELYDLWMIMQSAYIQKKLSAIENGPGPDNGNSKSIECLKTMNSSLKKNL